jgi:hypothetical protein
MTVAKGIGKSFVGCGKSGMAAVSDIMLFFGSPNEVSVRGKYLVHIRNHKTGNEIVVNELTDVAKRNEYLIFTGKINYITISIADIVNADEENNIVQINIQQGEVTYTIHQE